MTDKALCVQAFNKADSIVTTLDSLARSDGVSHFDLYVVQDGLKGNRFRDRYSAEHAQTTAVIKAWLETNSGAFRSARFLPQEQGRGTAGTARVTIDIALSKHDWMIFSEDDLVYEKDALQWFEKMIEHQAFLHDDVWAIAGESKYFDSKGKSVSETKLADANEVAKELDLISKFCFFDWLPSSCFATIPSKWAEFSETRGAARGPKFVNDRCKAENKKSLWPIIARCRDIGMHHEVGYSMSIHKDAEKIPQKSNFLVSGKLPPSDSPMEEYKDKSNIYRNYTVFFNTPGKPKS